LDGHAIKKMKSFFCFFFNFQLNPYNNNTKTSDHKLMKLKINPHNKTILYNHFAEFEDSKKHFVLEEFIACQFLFYAPPQVLGTHCPLSLALLVCRALFWG
jgi:hypothetical protein